MILHWSLIYQIIMILKHYMNIILIIDINGMYSLLLEKKLKVEMSRCSILC
jgi:F0F1-type ATP synthase beta subunit